MTTQYLTDGFSTKVSGTGFGNLYMVTVTPPGMDGGGPVNITTMFNTLYRTMNPKKLITVSPLTFNSAYATVAYTDMITNLNVNQAITITFPDTHTVVFWGYIDKFIPAEVSEGNMPLAAVTIQPTNHNNAVPYVETAPVYS